MYGSKNEKCRCLPFCNTTPSSLIHRLDGKVAKKPSACTFRVANLSNGGVLQDTVTSTRRKAERGELRVLRLVSE